MKNVELRTEFQNAVDEQFTAESKRGLVTNEDYSWAGAKEIFVYKVNTAPINDYNRDGELESGEWSRYGIVQPLDAVTENFKLTQDKSFTFMLDKMDVEETGEVLAVSSALARQNREVVIPMYDKYIYQKLYDNAGTISKPATLTDKVIYDCILDATTALDNAMVPESERVLLISPEYYRYLKKSDEIAMSTDVGQDMRLKGVVGYIDGVQVVKVPSSRLPENVGFILTHPCACVAPIKLEDYITHDCPPGLNGYLVEGRLYYDAFVMDNKKNAIYVHMVA